MNFKALISPIRFGPAPPIEDDGPGADVPRAVKARDLSRRQAALREAADILTELPDEGEALHCLQTGRYDLSDVIALLLDKYGVCDRLTIATLAFSSRNARQVVGWIDHGLVRQVTILVSEFFRQNSGGAYDELLTALSERGPGHTLRADRNHAKIVCFEFASGARLVIEGSANLRSNGNRENLTLFNDKNLCEYHAAWIQSECRK